MYLLRGTNWIFKFSLISFFTHFSEGQAGERWEPSNKRVLFRISGGIVCFGLYTVAEF
jgi:hypothetical protein